MHATDSLCTRGVEVFLKKTAITYHQNSASLLGFGRYAIAVFFKKRFDIASRGNHPPRFRILIFA